MRRIVTSDWQLADNARDRYRMDFVVKTLPGLIDKHKPDQLIVAGDLTESKDCHPAPLVNDIVNFFGDIRQSCEVIILQGNHDFLHHGHPYFEFLENLKGIHWIKRPEVLDNCLYLPHTRDHKKDWEHVDLNHSYDFIFAHNIFTGVSTQTGHALSGIPPNVFPESAYVISGDVHEPQIINKNIVYVGSPCLCDFGDHYQPRVLLLDDLDVKSIKVHGVQKRLIDYHWQGEKVQHSANEGDIVKIHVHIKMEHVSEWATIRQSIETWAVSQKFVVNTIVPLVSYVQGERVKAARAAKKSDAQYLTAYVERTGIDERTAQVGKEIVEHE
jgi:DNA repair exonuclease SbcCD nuclease subunit